MPFQVKLLLHLWRPVASEVTTNKPLESFYDQVAALLSSAAFGEEEVKLSWFYPPPSRFMFPVALFITM